MLVEVVLPVDAVVPDVSDREQPRSTKNKKMTATIARNEPMAMERMFTVFQEV